MALVHEKLKLVAQIVYTVYISPAFMTLWKVELESTLGQIIGAR